MEAFAAACRDAMRAGRAAETTANALIHKHCYRTIRRRHKLSANLAVRAIARAARRLKREKGADEKVLSSPCPPREGHTSVREGAARREEKQPFEVRRTAEYDARTVSIAAEEGTASLSTVEGRVTDIALDLSPRQVERLGTSRIVRGCLCETASRTYWLTLDLATLQRNEGPPVDSPPPEDQ